MIQSIFIIAFVVLFIHASTWPGMINNWVKRLTFNWPDWVKKPIYDCPICCAPWWGALILYLGKVTGTFPAYNWLSVILILFAAGGVNTVLIYMIASDKEEIKDNE